MTEITWIKLKTNMFENDKIKLIEALPDKDMIIVIWFKFYLFAVKEEDYSIVNLDHPENFTLEEFLAVVFERDTSEIQKALEVFKEIDIAEISENKIKIKKFWRTNQEIRNSKEYKKWRQDVFERDDYTCQRCGNRGTELNAHHKKPFAYYESLRFEITNGVTLCKSCHLEVHNGRN